MQHILEAYYFSSFLVFCNSYSGSSLWTLKEMTAHISAPKAPYKIAFLQFLAASSRLYTLIFILSLSIWQRCSRWRTIMDFNLRSTYVLLFFYTVHNMCSIISSWIDNFRTEGILKQETLEMKHARASS